MIDILDTIPIGTGPLPQLLAWWVGYLGMLTAVYILFICERSAWPLRVYAAFNALLGVSIYVTIRVPPWLPDTFSRPILVTVSLVLILGMALHLTYLVWQYYQLKPPWVRIGEILIATGQWLKE